MGNIGSGRDGEVCMWVFAGGVPEVGCFRSAAGAGTLCGVGGES